MKKIITHLNPDLDAISSIWLIKRFLLGWEKAEVLFVPAGKTLDDQPADSDPQVLHVDTGLGQLDHHQSAKIISAAQLTWDYILEKRKKEQINPLETEAVNRIVRIITEIDNARDLVWPEASSDRFEFYLHSLIYGIKRIVPDDSQLVDQGLIILDALLKAFKDKIKAEETIENEGRKFVSQWGKAIACETGNEKVLWEAEIDGYVLVLKFDPQFKKRAKIYSRFDSGVDLTKVYNKLKKIDPEADWFLHSSKKLLLISSDPEAKGTKLNLEELIKILKE